MAKDSEKMVDYMVMIVNEYADFSGISQKEAFSRLLSCGGIDALEESYEVEHTLPVSSTLDALNALYARSRVGLA
ncbi:DUF3791 domain-containing protein [Adlercreutzia sp. ZJ473]|uniref:DUF3791 domain-containing protein n=1 Tax=Adlercreutzia sp. ZJ473 TaxID=2722822 RepID=UPI00155560F9